MFRAPIGRAGRMYPQLPRQVKIGMGSKLAPSLSRLTSIPRLGVSSALLGVSSSSRFRFRSRSSAAIALSRFWKGVPCDCEAWEACEEPGVLAMASRSSSSAST